MLRPQKGNSRILFNDTLLNFGHSLSAAHSTLQISIFVSTYRELGIIGIFFIKCKSFSSKRFRIEKKILLKQINKPCQALTIENPE